MNVADLIEAPPSVRPVSSPGACPLRPGELPPPITVAASAADLEPGDTVVRGSRSTVVDMVARRADGMIRVRLADGSTHTCPPDAPLEVRRG